MKPSVLTALLDRITSLPVVVLVGVAASLLLSLALTGTLSAYTAAITNGANSVTSGSLVMRERTADGTVTCLSTDPGTEVATNTATCSTINKLGGGTIKPGGSSSSSIEITNLGTLPAGSFTLTPGSCTAVKTPPQSGGAPDFCSQLRLVITSGATTVFSGSLAQLSGGSPAISMPAAPAAGATVPFTFTVTLDAAAPNSTQGLTASVPMTWTFTS